MFIYALLRAAEGQLFGAIATICLVSFTAYLVPLC